MAEWMSTALNIGVGGATAVIGGFAGAYLSEWFAARRRAVDERNSQKSSAFALQLQLMGMYTDLVQYREHLGQSRVAFRARLPGPRFRAQYHQAFSGDQAEVHFRIEDLQALAAYGSRDLLNVVADLDRRFNGIAAALNQYRSGWLAVGDQLEGDIQGSIIVLSLTQKDMRRLGPKFASLSKILADLEPMVEEMVQDTYRGLVGLFHARVKSFGQTGTFEAINPRGVLERIEPDAKADPPKPKPLSAR
ncbi:MAG: hypothetical protein KJ728_05805 [Alphaproteobacteria bacterium]|uniref:hypothetical protein n=1 Tax=Brevundimonas sp. TaxID=1871086 RepID=UPI0035679A1B|nr:hypothetical protein [Alphaproteobacteria bacterium]MBU1520920.1 hypothetical protein [Alphaproteobacteria bacterium]MBU2349740.1 hypothetical protein [Alphaproteobacteria bacterium]